MSHGFSQIFTDRDYGKDLCPQFRRLLFGNDRKKIRANPCGSVAKASA
jgi:hypothetical protein